MCRTPAILSIRDDTGTTTCRVKQGETSTRAENESTNKVDCVQQAMLRSKTLRRAPFLGIVACMLSVYR